MFVVDDVVVVCDVSVINVVVGVVIVGGPVVDDMCAYFSVRCLCVVCQCSCCQCEWFTLLCLLMWVCGVAVGGDDGDDVVV